MRVNIVEAIQAQLAKLISKLGTIPSRAKSTFKHIKKSEVAEALIATWAIEFLRVRRLGGFHVLEIIVISTLMLGVKAIISEAGRRQHNVRTRSYAMPNKRSRMESVDFNEYAFRTRYGPRHTGRNRGRFKRRDPYTVL